ncbi:MAG: hypothetical protein Q7U06_00240 [Pseudomonadota bacterium]|nr:hypothetical protein [Pseudomonadota bacterium]
MKRLTLALLAACSPPGQAPDSEGVPAVGVPVYYESGGLPMCAESLPDAALCAGWGRNSSAWFGDSAETHPYLWEQGYVPVLVTLSWWERETGERICADEPAEAAAHVTTRLSIDVLRVDEADARWFDVYFNEQGAYRVFRCAAFTSVGDLSDLLPDREIPTLWQTATAPAVPAEFFDLAKEIETHRMYLSEATVDRSRILLLGTSGDDTTLRLRSCRLRADWDETVNGEGSYEHELWESEYTMDIASGNVGFVSSHVRTVACPTRVF